MTAPTRVAGWHSTTATNGTAQTSTSFSLTAGDVLVVVVASDGAGTAPAAPTASAGSVTWTKRQAVENVASQANLTLWTGAVGATASATVTCNVNAALNSAMFVEQYSGVSAVGASAKAQNATTGSVALTTTAANSAVVVAASDFNAVTGTITWRTVNGAAITAEATYQVAADYCAYFGYRNDCGAAGANTYGVSTPTSQQASAAAVELQGSSATNYTSTPGDAEGLSDSLTVAQDNVRAQGDALGLTDAAVAAVDRPRAQADNAGITDSAAAVQGMARTQADNAGISDAVTVVQSQSVSQGDPVGLTDAAAAVQANTRTQADSLGITDSVLAQKGQSIALADNLGLTDSAAATQDAVRTASDPVGVADSVAIVQAQAITQADTVGLADGLTAAQDNVRAAADSLGLTDSLLVQAGQAVAQGDSVGIADAVTDALDASRPPADTAGLTDNVTVSLGYVRAQADTAGITDAVLTVLGLARVQGDTVAITDSMVAVLVRNSTDRDIVLAAVPLPTRWTASELLPRWAVQAIADLRYSVAAYVPTITTTELPTRWATALNPGETMSVDIIATAGAVKYVGGTITETTGKDISADTFVMSLGSDKNPGTTWVAPDQSVAGATNNIRTLKLLVSASLPTGIVVPGTYWVWAKITDTPEVEPIRLQGPITVR